jgi:hypothetical protein
MDFVECWLPIGRKEKEQEDDNVYPKNIATDLTNQEDGISKE